MEIQLTSLGRLVATCWDHAEAETAKAVADKYPDPSEEQITFLFAGELRMAVAQASRERQFEQAFLADLRMSIPHFDENAARRAGGLIARVNFHSRHHEGRRSASDLGIVIRRPFVRLGPLGTHVELRPDHARGLLAQAKLGRCIDPSDTRFTWRGLTQPQERLIPRRRDYYSLLLYRLQGQTASELRPFRWQLCRDHTVREIKAWLRSDAFPKEESSSDVMRGIVAGAVGTEDAAAIETIVDPAASGLQVIDLHIFWPDGATPPAVLEVCRQPREEQKVRELQR